MAHDIETVRNALRSVVPELHARANVVATGVGHKVSEGRRTTDISIVCSVTQKLDAAELRGVVSVGIGRNEDGRAVIVVGLDRERSAARAQLPECLEGYEVRAEVVGKVKAGSAGKAP